MPFGFTDDNHDGGGGDDDPTHNPKIIGEIVNAHIKHLALALDGTGSCPKCVVTNIVANMLVLIVADGPVPSSRKMDALLSEIKDMFYTMQKMKGKGNPNETSH